MQKQSWKCLASIFAGLIVATSAHSWPEALNLVNDQGTIYGPTGYVRNFVPRNATGFKGDETDSFQKTQNVQGAKVCMPRETTQSQSPGYPRLAVTPGAKVALRYAENGHVTIEQAGRPPHGGPVYVFGSTDGTANPLITDIMQWNAQGTGGNKGGKLLATQNFDDGRCYENNPSPIAQQRKAANPIGNQLALPFFSGLPCQNDFTVPTDAKAGQPYTIYWLWNFTFPDTSGGTELFSNCLDFDVLSQAASGQAANAEQADFNAKQPPISAAVSSYFVEMAFASTAPTPTSSPQGQPSSASLAPQTPARSPSSSAHSAASPAGLVSEGSGGQLYAPTLPGTPAAQTSLSSPAASPGSPQSPSIKTVFVTVLPSGIDLPSMALPSPSTSSPVASPSAVQPSTPAASPVTPAMLGSSAQPITPQQTAQTSPAQASPVAQQSPQPHIAQASVESADGLRIPLLTIGTGGVSPVSMSMAPTATAAVPQQHNAQQESNSASPMPSGEGCKKERQAARRSRIYPFQ